MTFFILIILVAVAFLVALSVVLIKDAEEAYEEEIQFQRRTREQQAALLCARQTWKKRKMRET